MTRVLHLIHTGGPGGAETVCVELARRMDSTRWTSIVGIPGEGWVEDQLRRHSIPFLYVSPRKRLALMRDLVVLIRRERIGLIHAHLLSSAFYSSIVGRAFGIPVVSTFHGISDVNASPGWTESLRYGIIQRGCHVVVCVSEPLREELVRRQGYPRSHTAVVVNGVDVDEFRPGHDRTFRRELGLKDDHILVGAVGNVRPPKDYPNLLRTAARLVAISDRYRFVIVGDPGDGLAELLALREELGLSRHVVFAGFRPDVSRIMPALDIFVLSSSTEGFSLSTVQAMSAGVPAVATRCGGPEQILRHEVEGLLVPVSDPAALAAAIERLRLDDTLRAQLVRRARERVEAEYSIAAMVRRYDALYESARGLAERARAAAV